MIELIYVSRAKQHFGEPQLLELLEQARANNTRSGITGLLLYDNKGTFIQALEGDDEQVDSLYEKILQDSRHSNLSRISRRAIETRTFPDWKMGFKLVDLTSLKSASGFSQYMQDQDSVIDSQNAKGLAIELLDYFKHSDNSL